MRSRYSAFCQGNVDYLIETHHPNHSNADERKSLKGSVKQTQWTNLIVIKTQKGQRKDKTGTVEFVAAYRSLTLIGIQNSTGKDSSTGEDSIDKVEQLHERSRFVREKGQWLYTDGDRLPDYEPKRSQPCWCGSQKPFKHCHG